VGVAAIDRRREQVSIKFQANAAIDPARLAQFVSSRRGAQFSPDGTLKFLLKVSSAEEVFRHLRELLQALAGEVPHEAQTI
ncbi:MAG TPA: hypothetical protein VJQ82_12950, partial [Terriglobales bacterium]|nr:hypothetical protein [Terriglobales bacterium]